MRTIVLLLTLLISVPLSAQAPVIIQQPVNTTVTLGQRATFSVSASGATGYQWYRDYQKIAGATASSYALTPGIAETNHQYTATVLGPGNTSVQSATVNLHVTPRTDIATVHNVEDFGVVAASQVANSPGLGVDSNQDWEFAAVAAMGFKWIRQDGCQWEQLELQNTASNTSEGFSLANAPNCQAAITSAKNHNLNMDSEVYWAPPHGQIAVGTVASDVSIGSTSVPLTITSGSLSGYPATSLLIYGLNGSALQVNGTTPLNQHIDFGVPVADISGTTLTLAEASVADLPAGTPVTIQGLLYPPALIAPGGPASYTSNASVQAWGNYVAAVQGFISAAGVSGLLEEWNEPENFSELWDHPSSYYTSPPAHYDSNGGTGRYLAEYTSTLPLVSGVKLLNGWSNLNGYAGIYGPGYSVDLPVAPSQVNAAFGGDAVHPYGINPEEGAWIPAQLLADAAAGTENFQAETPIGGAYSDSLKIAPYFDAIPSSQGGIPIVISETGIQMVAPVSPTQTQRTRFNLRQFLVYSGVGVHPIIFYKAGNDTAFEWFQEDASHTPYPVVAAFSGLMTDINTIASSPITPAANTPLPQVSSYTGYYPLATTAFVGSRTGDLSNSVLFYSWQKTYTVPPGGGSTGDNYSTNNPPPIPPIAFWTTLPSPPAVPLTVTVPAGFVVASVKNAVTQSPVLYLVVGSSLTYLVADDPIQVMLIPATIIAVPTSHNASSD